MAWCPPGSGGAAWIYPSRHGFDEQHSHGSLSKSPERRYSSSSRKQSTSARRASHFAVHFKATKWHNGHCTINVSHILWSALSVSVPGGKVRWDYRQPGNALIICMRLDVTNGYIGGFSSGGVKRGDPKFVRYLTVMFMTTGASD